MKTRFLILSDTHAKPYKAPRQSADVALHCGDLTRDSTLEEFRSVIQLLSEIDAPIKLAIAGNHDLTLDLHKYKQRLEETPTERLESVKKEYGEIGEARRLLEAASIILLDEGIHHFKLENGAALSIYASPYTPAYGAWAFQYPRQQGHEFNIMNADIAMTHGPPRGILDLNNLGNETGCSSLFAAIAQARPKIHCFGHIHEAWGAELVAWRETDALSEHSSPIDRSKSVEINNLRKARDSAEFKDKLEAQQRNGYYFTSHCADDPNPIRKGEETLVVNASIQGRGWGYFHLPWLVDIELSKAE